MARSIPDGRQPFHNRPPSSRSWLAEGGNTRKTLEITRELAVYYLLLCTATAIGDAYASAERGTDLSSRCRKQSSTESLSGSHSNLPKRGPRDLEHLVSVCLPAGNDSASGALHPGSDAPAVAARP